ncbi:hypothetical protein Ndes2526B_g06051 [Nannochloris sp. 'desiccata']|nr:hypothetical protein NADE_005945 [Chlorella desiccata (nom. nud.)]
MEGIVQYPFPLAPEPDTQCAPEAVAMPTGTAEEEVDPTTVPMQEIVASSPHVDSNASEGDNLALLPRNTVVRIAGNNRTKASLIGLEAKVRRSTGLGGWHWLVLPSGEEIKLQRNALTVLEYPTGLEAESSASEGDRHKPATPHIPRYGPVLETQRLPAKRPRPVSTLPSDYLDGSRRVSLRQQYAGIGPSIGSYSAAAVPVDHGPAAAYAPHFVDFDKLQTKSLRKYLTTYNLNTTSITRETMVRSAQRHFAGVEITEEDVVRNVLEAARRNAYG